MGRQVRNQDCPALNSTCHCFPKNSDLIGCVCIFLENYIGLFTLILVLASCSTQICSGNGHNNQPIGKRIFYCALPGLFKNQVPLPNSKCCRKENTVEWALQVLKTGGSLDADSPSQACQSCGHAHDFQQMQFYEKGFFISGPAQPYFYCNSSPARQHFPSSGLKNPPHLAGDCHHNITTAGGQALQNQALMAF